MESRYLTVIVKIVEEKTQRTRSTYALYRSVVRTMRKSQLVRGVQFLFLQYTNIVCHSASESVSFLVKICLYFALFPLFLEVSQEEPKSSASSYSSDSITLSEIHHWRCLHAELLHCNLTLLCRKRKTNYMTVLFRKQHFQTKSPLMSSIPQ